MNMLTTIPAFLSRAVVCAIASRCPRTSSPPSVVISSRFSGTSVQEYGFRSQAIRVISPVAAISRLIRVVTTDLSTARSRSWMWRRSSRRWTVIPSAPECSAIDAAAAGSGTRPRRAWRSVATWSMLTPSRFRAGVIGLLPSPSRPAPSRSPRPRPGFSPSTMMRSSGSVPLYRTTIRPRLPSAFSNSAWAFRNPFIDSSGTRCFIRMLCSICGKTTSSLPQFGDLLSRLDHDGEQLQRREHPVARRGVIEEDQVPRLLPAEVVPAGPHRLDDVPVPDRGAQELDLPLLRGTVRGRCCS